MLWLAGMAGVVAFAMLPLPPELLARQPALPLWALQLAGLALSGVLLAVAVALGVRLAPAVALHAPAFEALVARGGVGRALRAELVPGLVGALLAGGVLLLFRGRAPGPVEAVAAHGFDPSLAVRVLYGGVTEELLLRFGVMTLLLWLAAPGARRRGARPGGIAATFAIVASAVLFGIGHLPTIVAFGGSLTREVVLYVIVGNTLFGCVTGALYRGYGLEAAMIAHAGAHVLAFFA